MFLPSYRAYFPPMPFTHSTTHFGSLPIFMALWSALHMLSVMEPVNVCLSAANIRAAEAIARQSISQSSFSLNSPVLSSEPRPRQQQRRYQSQTREYASPVYGERPISHLDPMRAAVRHHALQCSIGLIKTCPMAVHGSLPAGEKSLAQDNHSFARHVRVEDHASRVSMHQADVIGIAAQCERRTLPSEENLAPRVGRMKPRDQILTRG